MLGILVVSRTTASRDPAGILEGRSGPDIPGTRDRRDRLSVKGRSTLPVDLGEDRIACVGPMT